MVSDTHMENIWDSAYSPVGQATSPLRPDTQHQRRYEDAKGFCRPASFIRTRFGCACFASPPEGKTNIFLFLFARACDEHNWRDFRETGVLRDTIPPSGFRGYLDGDARFQRRRLDV